MFRSSPAPCFNQRRWDGQTYYALSLVYNAQPIMHHTHTAPYVMHSTHDVLPEQESVQAISPSQRFWIDWPAAGAIEIDVNSALH